MIKNIGWKVDKRLNKISKNKVEDRICEYRKKEKKKKKKKSMLKYKVIKVISWIMDKRLKKIVR